MNPSLLPSTFFIITIIIFTPTVVSSISYSDHCNSFSPEAIPTTSVFTRYPFLEPVTSHYTGGQNILGPNSPSQRSILFTPTKNLFRTESLETYKIQARLTFIQSNIYRFQSNNSRFYRPLVFYLDGFWSVSTNKLCMVGSANWVSKTGKPLELNAVLKLNFARFINLNNSLVSGILESLGSVDDRDYFEPISMMGFPRVAPFKYNYSLVSNEECDGPNGNNFTQEVSVASMKSLDLCSIFTNKFKSYKLDNNSMGLSPSVPAFLSLYSIQCSLHEKKLRFLLELQDRRYSPYDQSFNPNITLIGDGTWNGTKNEVCILACYILNQSDPLGSARVGDCSVRLTVWFVETRSITNTHTTEGQIWSTKKPGDDGYFELVKFQSFDHSFENYGSKYEFTKLEKVRQVCPSRRYFKREGASYPSGYNWDMTFDMFVNNGKANSTGSAVPIFVGNQFYNSYEIVGSSSSQWQAAPPSAATYTSSMNISYEIIFTMPFSWRLETSMKSSSESPIPIPLLRYTNGSVAISAEGVYDSETGRLCMVGCRKIPSFIIKSGFDCEIQVRFRFPRIDRNNGSFLIRGSIESLRDITDPLYFDRLKVVSLTYTETQAKESLWRMDLEIIMDLISRTLSCFFIVLQLFHVKKNPETTSLISVLMMVILTIGYMVPLMLNFEAMFSNTRYLQNIPLGGSGGLLEVNEVIVRIVTMVAFVLQFRLLQLAWNSKLRNDDNIGKSNWRHEIRTLIVCLPIYVIGGLIMLVANWKNNDYITSSQRSIWGDLRSYAGLTLDGFLFPQIVINIFQISKGKALSGLFYTGNTFVRLLPHVYDLYRGQKNISRQFDRFYLYANPRADFYSPSWDVFIACGGVVFAVIVFFQQRFGGRFMLPKRFQEAEYEMVPVVNNE
ncbi:hypothetical protein LXL04_016503 [Taraxacum kok-saghyz]